jgi:hypothetical protein
MIKSEHEQYGVHEDRGHARVDAAEIAAGLVLGYGIISPFLVAAGIMTGNEVLAKIGIPGCAGDALTATIIGSRLFSRHM